MLITVTRRDWIRSWASRALRFAGLGAVTLAFSVGCTGALHELAGLSERLAYGITLMALVIVNFAASRHLVFPGSTARLHRQLAAFIIASLLFRGAELAGFVIITGLGWLPYPVVIVLVQGVSFCLKLGFYGGVLFASPSDDSGTANS